MPFGPWPGGGTGGGGGGALGLNPHEYYPDQVIVPSTDWPVLGIAPSDQDNTTPFASVFEWSQTVEEGRGWSTTCPVGAVSYTLQVVAKPGAVPAGVRTMGLKLYYRRIKPNVAPTAWASLVLPDFTFQANLFPQFGAPALLVLGGGAGQLDVLPGEIVYFELTRIAPTAGTNLTGDAHALRISDRWD